MSLTYYNENNKFAAQWLRNLIDAGQIAPGYVDERSIEDVYPNELRNFTQCHFFAGIGVWSYALRSAGWCDDRPVWTGSCPCQPFSAAGKGAGFADERHLWPAFYHLIKECQPTVIFGEQVAAKAVEPWIDLVHADLEALGYAFGCVPFPSAGVGAPHIRDRAYWMADTDYPRPQGRRAVRQRTTECAAGQSGMAGGMAATCDRAGQRSEPRATERGLPESAGQDAALRPGPANGLWRAADWLFCRDEKWRPVEPGTFPLAHGATARVGRLRAYGNAINAKAAQAFIESVMEVI